MAEAADLSLFERHDFLLGNLCAHVSRPSLHIILNYFLLGLCLVTLSLLSLR